MGRVKGRDIKVAAAAFLQNLPEAFSPDFNKDKDMLRKLGFSHYKKQRNKLAGMIARIVKAWHSESEGS